MTPAPAGTSKIWRRRFGRAPGRIGSTGLRALRGFTRSSMLTSRPLLLTGLATVNVLPTDTTSASMKLGAPARRQSPDHVVGDHAGTLIARPDRGGIDRVHDRVVLDVNGG